MYHFDPRLRFLLNNSLIPAAAKAISAVLYFHPDDTVMDSDLSARFGISEEMVSKHRFWLEQGGLLSKRGAAR